MTKELKFITFFAAYAGLRRLWELFPFLSFSCQALGYTRTGSPDLLSNENK